MRAQVRLLDLDEFLEMFLQLIFAIAQQFLLVEWRLGDKFAYSTIKHHLSYIDFLWCYSLLNFILYNFRIVYVCEQTSSWWTVTNLLILWRILLILAHLYILICILHWAGAMASTFRGLKIHILAQIFWRSFNCYIWSSWRKNVSPFDPVNMLLRLILLIIHVLDFIVWRKWGLMSDAWGSLPIVSRWNRIVMLFFGPRTW